MELRLIRFVEADGKIRNKIDPFILRQDTNGEFVNSVQYLSYHPSERFNDDSVIVIDAGNQEVKAIMMAASIPEDKKQIISHPGTTFSGPILSCKTDIKEAMEILERIFSYYEERYETVEIRLRPPVYDRQPMEWIQYLLMRRGYHYHMMALANVINLQEIGDEEGILYCFNSGRRNHVKKVIKKANYVVQKRVVPERRAWENLSHNLEEKFNSKTTHTYEEIVKLCEIWPECIQSYSAERNDGEYGALVLVYKYKSVFHTQYLDVNYKYASEYPHLYLLYELIREAKRENYRYFSFGASTEERGKILNEGLFQYKNGYGGGSILLPVMTWNREE